MMREVTVELEVRATFESAFEVGSAEERPHSRAMPLSGPQGLFPWSCRLGSIPTLAATVTLPPQ
jgi:hypothetical protein